MCIGSILAADSQAGSLLDQLSGVSVGPSLSDQLQVCRVRFLVAIHHRLCINSVLFCATHSKTVYSVSLFYTGICMVLFTVGATCWHDD